MPNSLAKLAQLARTSNLLRQGFLQKESTMMGAVGKSILGVGKGTWNTGANIAEKALQNPVRNTMAAVGTAMLPSQFSSQSKRNISGFDPARHNLTLGITPGAGALQGGGGVSQ